MLPDTVKTIGESAFERCSNLTEIVLPKSLAEIGSSSFLHCSNLSKIELPNTITKIGYLAFAGCSSLSEITIPYRVETIGSYAFDECKSLKTINVQNDVSLENAFGEKGIIPEEVKIVRVNPPSISESPANNDELKSVQSRLLGVNYYYRPEEKETPKKR